MIEARLRTRIHPDELELKKGRIVTDGDFNMKLTGAARVLGPDGKVLAVYLPGAVLPEMDAAWSVLRTIKMPTDNRGMASGTEREQRGDQKRTRTRNIFSAILGSVDPGPASSKVAGRLDACRMTAWTGAHQEEWIGLRPLFQAVAREFAESVPDRYAAQMAFARRTQPEWLIPGTPFTTITVNNSYSTGVHQDRGDLKEGFSTLIVGRSGSFTGGELVLAEYRLAVDMRHGDLLLFDPHQWHGNTAMVCEHQDGPLAKPCPAGCERVSVVSYFRTKVCGCGNADQEFERAMGVPVS